MRSARLEESLACLLTAALRDRRVAQDTSPPRSTHCLVRDNRDGRTSPVFAGCLLLRETLVQRDCRSSAELLEADRRQRVAHDNDDFVVIDNQVCKTGYRVLNRSVVRDQFVIRCVRLNKDSGEALKSLRPRRRCPRRIENALGA